MIDTQVRLPLAVRLLNLGGKTLQRVYPRLARLDAAALLARAAKNTGLHDFGGGPYREGLAQLIGSLENEASLHLLGRFIARGDIVRTLESRLRIVGTLRRHPEITAKPVTRPLFILGMPRTGTSILHELMAQDPANRVPMTWEVMQPWPPPDRATFHRDPRIAATDSHLAGVDRLIPGFKSIHPMGALLPQECVALTQHDFATMIYHTTHNVPSYQAWLEQLDMRPVYAFHKQQLQYFQWHCAAERWVLKSPGHLWSLDALLAIYPDARIVQTHRDPLKVIASLVSLMNVLRRMASDDVEPAAMARDWTERLAQGLQRTMDVRASGALPASQVFDMQFGEFMRDEIAMVRRIYDHFGLTFSDLAEERMRAFLANNRVDKHGRHAYRLANTGLDEAHERERYRTYSQTYNVLEE